MGKEYDVAADLKIYMQDLSKVNNIKSEMEKIAKVQRFWEEDVGFGIKVLKATILLLDSEGGIDKVEEKIRKINSVSELEVENVTRV